MNKPYTMCPTCQRILIDTHDKKFLKDFGECPLCDHLRPDVMDQEKEEHDKNEN
jgi:hydrogenase maturation factor HypF (carbamoyltransferase family)